jgi:hypothetical protein
MMNGINETHILRSVENELIFCYYPLGFYNLNFDYLSSHCSML